MDGLAPPLKCLIEVRWALENGQSLRSALLRYCRLVKDDFTLSLNEWLVLRDRGQDLTALLAQQKSPHRRILLELFDQGLQGIPILVRLQEIQEELIRVCEEQIQRQLTLLPFKCLIPLLGFQFPAFLILLFGPLLNQFTKGIS